MTLETILMLVAIVCNILIAFYVVRAAKEFIRNKEIERADIYLGSIDKLAKVRDHMLAYGYTEDAKEIDETIKEKLSKFEI